MFENSFYADDDCSFVEFDGKETRSNRSSGRIGKKEILTELPFKGI